MYGKLMSIALCAVDNVGATIGRPAHKCSVFASVFGKFVTLYRRAAGRRPYEIIVRLSDKLKFEETENTARRIPCRKAINESGKLCIRRAAGSWEDGLHSL